jgi:predicted nucleic acid-binding Zn ribbon protein
MSRRSRDHPDHDDDDGTDEYDADRDYDPDEPETYPSGLYDDDGPAVVPCPFCRAEVLEDTERCPRCGNYLSREDAPSREPKSRFWMVMMILALLLAAFWVIAG